MLYSTSFSQNKDRKVFVEWTTWTLIQTIPSLTYSQDRNESDSRMQFGLRWHVTPVNYSFNANEMVSPVQFFKVNPLRRYGGSVELFLQPEWTTGHFQYSNLKRFGLSTGARVFIPAVEYGEYLSFSLGGKYKIRKDKSGTERNTYAAEVGVYSLFGIFGFQFNYNFSKESRYNFGLYFKYY